MSEERIAALEAEVERLKHRLDQPEVQMAFGSITTAAGQRVTTTLTNVGILPFQVTRLVVCGPEELHGAQGQVSYHFDLENQPPWPLLPGESRRFDAQANTMAALQATMPTDWRVVAKSGDKLIGEAPIAGLQALL